MMRALSMWLFDFAFSAKFLSFDVFAFSEKNWSCDKFCAFFCKKMVV